MISAVVVAYEPDVDKLENLIKSLKGEVTNLIIVNNGSELTLSPKVTDGFSNHVIKELGDNLGIGRAQNIGVSISVDFGSKHSILLDQDSFVPKGMVSGLLEGFSCSKVAAVGPTVVDSRTGNKFQYFTYNGLARTDSLDYSQYSGSQFYETDCLISSGTIVDNDIFSKNINNEDLFIEFVDVEWCLRIKNENYVILFSSNVEMPHELGDSREKVLGVEFPLHKPSRYFFVTRNSIYCSLVKGFPISFKLYTLLRLFVLISFVLVKSPKKIDVLKNVFKGFFAVKKLRKIT